MENRIALRRLGNVLVRPGTAHHGDYVVATIGTEMARLGFAPSPELLDALRSVDQDRLAGTVRGLLDALAYQVGAHRTYAPFYPNFPDGVIARSEAELYFNALRHYWTGGSWRPEPNAARPREGAWRRLRSALSTAEVPEPTSVGLAWREEFDAVLTRLAGSASSLSAVDVADMDWFVRQYRGRVATLLPDVIPHREVAALLAAGLWRHADLGREFVERHISSATDVLRWFVALSGGDVSLAEPALFVTAPRAARRLAMDILERAPGLVDDLHRRPERWKRLGERLHPGEFAATHPKTVAAFEALRRGGAAPTFASQVERSLECFAGWMRRESAGSGEVFDPRTVVDKVDLTAETTIAIPLFFDLAANQVIWADLALRKNPRFVNAVGPNTDFLAG